MTPKKVSALENARLVLRKYLLANKEKVADDLQEMREKSSNSIDTKLEEAANRLFYTVGNEGIASIDSFMKGANYQAERMYSEEEVIKLLISCKDRFGGSGLEDYTHDNEVKNWFERIKKK